MPSPSENPRRLSRAIAFAAASVLACAASAQLRQDEVLVIYDSRIPDSLAVAEYYAGSARVPGGAGGLAGARPGVRVFNLATSGAAVSVPGNIAYANINSQLQGPIRAHLTATGLTTRVRCLVTTKGLPHRVTDSDNATVGDFPGNVGTEFLANDYTCSAVDAELTLLWQNLTTGEAGAALDSTSDGCVLNPFWKSAVSIAGLTNVNIAAAKTLVALAPGPVWQPSGGFTSPSRLNPGDIYLVCRLDARTVADVRAMIDRSQGFVLNPQTAAMILDESNSNAIADAAGNSEFDNVDSAMPILRDADDYERTRDLTTADGRWAAGFIRYNALAAFNQMFVGPNQPWQPNHGIRVNDPVALLASFGLNHSGQPLITDGTQGGTVLPLSFNYAPGAVFNTLESYSGRDFGGLGTLSFARQGQAADFIQSGGTFAAVNVWEPLADSVPDNRLLVQNFLLGTMSWAEASWSAIPALSWMQMSVGDPLARVQRTTEDLNADGRVDVSDLYAWEQSPVDINRSGGAPDAADRAILVRSLRAGERNDLHMPR